MTNTDRFIVATCPGGHKVRIIARMQRDITQRYEALVQGKVVGWGFVTADDAIARGIKAVAEKAFNEQD